MTRCAKRAFYVDGIKVHSGTAIWVDPHGQRWLIVTRTPRVGSLGRPQTSQHLAAAGADAELHYRELPDGAVLQLTRVPGAAVAGLALTRAWEQILAESWRGQNPAHPGLPGLVFRHHQTQGRAGQRGLALAELRSRCASDRQYAELLTAAVLPLMTTATWGARDRELVQAWLVTLGERSAETPGLLLLGAELLHAALGRLDPSELYEPLLMVVHHRDAELRYWVLDTLTTRPERLPSSVATTLVRELSGDASESVRARLTQTLPDLASLTDAETLRTATTALAGDPVMLIRGDLARELGRMGESLDTPVLEVVASQLAGDHEPHVRSALAATLGELALQLDATSLQPLVGRLAADAAAEVRAGLAQAVDGLAPHLEPLILRSLVTRLAADPDHVPRMYLARSLEKAVVHLDTATARTLAQQLSGDPDHRVRMSAAEMLGGAAPVLGAGTAAPLLAQLAQDPHDWVRLRTVAAVGQAAPLLDPGALNEAVAHLVDDPSVVVVAELAKVLPCLAPHLDRLLTAQAAMQLVVERGMGPRLYLIRAALQDEEVFTGFSEHLGTRTMHLILCAAIAHDDEGAFIVSLKRCKHLLEGDTLRYAIEQYSKSRNPTVQIALRTALSELVDTLAARPGKLGPEPSASQLKAPRQPEPRRQRRSWE